MEKQKKMTVATQQKKLNNYNNVGVRIKKKKNKKIT